MMAPVNLLGLNSVEFKQFLDSFDHVFSDCDGVLWATHKAFQGVGNFFKLMEENGKTVHFVSNNSIRGKENYSEMFHKVDISGGFEKLITPSIAMVEYLKLINFDKHVYCVTCPETKKIFEMNGFKTKFGPDDGHDSWVGFVNYFKDDPDIGAVAFDSDYNLNMAKIYKAITYLKRPDVLFLDGPTEKFIEFAGKTVLGLAFATDLVADVAKRKPISLGKPSQEFGKLAMRRAGVTDPSRVLFIGDMIAQDVTLGKNTGFKTMLVLTHLSEEQMRASDIQPDYYAPDLGSVVPKLSEL